MSKVSRNQKGFTLLEVIVVLAVLGALAAMLSPVVFRYVDDANRVRAQNDTRAIAAAINQMYKDTGRWPFYAAGTGAIALGSSDADFLTSNPDCAGVPEAGTCDDTAPIVASGADWSFGAGDMLNALSSQLIANTPSYPSTRYRGPYLDAVPELDPWGRSYVVNIGNAAPGGTYWVIVASAGADGELDTDSNTLLTAPTVATADDIIARVK